MYKVKRAGIWTKDWLLGGTVAIVLFLTDFIRSLGRKAHGIAGADSPRAAQLTLAAMADFETDGERAQALRARAFGGSVRAAADIPRSRR